MKRHVIMGTLAATLMQATSGAIWAKTLRIWQKTPNRTSAPMESTGHRNTWSR
jgi:hypothetical protein